MHTNVWTGRLSLGLVGPDHVRFGTIEIVVRLDDVAFWLNERLLAFVDRDTLHRWWTQPRIAFGTEDIVIAYSDGYWLSIDGARLFRLSDETSDTFSALP